MHTIESSHLNFNDVNDELNALLMAVHGGCRPSFARLYALTSARLYAITLRITRNTEDAEDVLQDLYVKVWTRCSQFDETKGRAIHWLSAIARFLAIDRLRRRGVRWTEQLADDAELGDAAVPSSAAGFQPGDRLMQAQCEGAIQQHLQTLTIRQRTLLNLAFHEGLSHPEIARQIDSPLGSVKSWMRRTLISMRPAMAAHR